MRNNKKIKMIVMILLVIFLALFITNGVYAATAKNFNFNAFDSNTNASADAVAQSVMGTGIQVVKIVGIGMATIMLSYIGIKYMIAAPNEKADLKKSLAIYVLGAILVLGATGVLSIIAKFAKANGIG